MPADDALLGGSPHPDSNTDIENPEWLARGANAANASRFC